MCDGAGEIIGLWSETTGGQTIRCPRCFALGWTEQPVQQRSEQGQSAKDSGTDEEESPEGQDDPDAAGASDPETPAEAVDWDAVQGFLKEEEVRKDERNRPSSTTGREPPGTGNTGAGGAAASTTGGSPETEGAVA